MKPLRIRIVGGSVGGLFAGVLLQRDGHDVRIYERSAGGLSGRGAGLVGQPDLFRLLRRIGADHVARVGVVAHERIFLDPTGAIESRIQSPQSQISWDYLYDTVAAKFDPANYVLGRPVIDVVDGAHGAQISFGDGSTETVDLVVAADGIGSVVRKALDPEDHDNRFAGYVAWRGLIAETSIPAEASILLNRFAFFTSYGSQALGYLVPGAGGEADIGSRRYNWVWYRQAHAGELPRLFTDRDGAVHRFSLPRGGLSTDRRDAFRAEAATALPPQFLAVVEAEAEPSIQGIFDYESATMVGQSVALLGDAAFVVRPHTAMGVSKAAGDAMALRDSLATASRISDALGQFERQRLPVGLAIAEYGRRLGDDLRP
ncbi:FAD binding domain-containing protein [Labrys monachus]|uniref:2-polyprenyl-6-methoxyphenol hydroxylase-like FAD-dependent oxidoreductase n=1 Tax=Labrys monachus TaxID=217067 RepID=A0ABU0F8M8_9HYPH|nr:2-polyprenyl-6-methoxyphenol hydroxylase [Labrys monachus]MDQ0390891.1 2-polyprenyl-6-methoxyphenol hydroxylase-like FAD-dependent oxidoreductase [Labrys monachus]